MNNYSYKNECNLHFNEFSFSREWMGAKTRFEREAKDYSELPIPVTLYYSYRL